jgi:hypothetical protein
LNVEEAQQIVSTLEGRLVEVTNAATQLQEARRIAFDANTGDEKARKALDKANAASASAALEIENVRSAIEEARRRLGEAEHAEQMAGLAEKADEVKKLAAEFEQLGPEVDADFVSVRGKLERAMWIVDRFHVLGVTHPRGEQIKVLGGLALATALMGLPLKAEREHLAPRERKTFTELFGGWASGAVNLALSWLNKEAA